GNLLPMTSNSSFSIFWKMYSVFVWSLELVYVVTLIPACFLVPIEKALSDGVTTLIVMIESVFTIVRIHVQTTLIQQLIQKLNESLNTEDKNMKNIVIMAVNPLKTPFKFYLVIGTFSVFVWSCLSFLIIFERSTFYYADFRSPAIYSKEPFSINVFLLGNVISMVSNVYIFLKKVSVDIYTTHLISLITSQYHCIASRLVLVFRNTNRQDNSSFSENDFTNSCVEKEMKSLCRVAQRRLHAAEVKCRKAAKKTLLTPGHRAQRMDFAMNHLDITEEEWQRVIWMDEKTFSTDKDGRYRVWRTDNTRYEPNNVLPSTSSGHVTAAFWAWMSADGPGDLVEVGRNFNAEQYVDILDGVMLPSSTDITDKAFHEDWNRFSLSIKHSFLLAITASNNITINLSLFENFNLSLPSFMAVINQSYTIALLILKMK
ncbi:PREDICTED: uncharacterized protein LOC105462598, partial [Wasmannia auropunctata]|uniref:uncharacterized protein LOC105462598 n=1 Tax=Wasmannia auropunctata TaxID=64793 RepID=UPI0005F084CB